MKEMENILIIGCGGIGTEIIKICCIKKYSKLTFADFDRIEYSNLNRQFIFSKDDIGKYKVEAMQKFYLNHLPNANIEIIRENIIGELFTSDYLNKFSIIFNCLDNLEARKFISKRYFIAKKNFKSSALLIDGGSGGYFGQARYFNGFNCYDCLNIIDMSENLTVCTIRNIPTKFHHCVIWAADKIEDGSKRIKSGSKSHTIHQLACKRAEEFKLKKEDVFYTENILKNVIPTLASTNSIIASLMFIALKDCIDIFLSADGFFSMNLERNEKCTFCAKSIFLIYFSDFIDFDEIRDYFNIKGPLCFVDESNNIIIDMTSSITSNKIYALNGEFILYFLKGNEFDIIEI